MTLKEQVALFTLDLAELIIYVKEQGFQCYLKELGDLWAHLVLLNQEGQEEDSPESYSFMVDFWESLSKRNKSGLNRREPLVTYFERLKE